MYKKLIQKEINFLNFYWLIICRCNFTTVYSIPFLMVLFFIPLLLTRCFKIQPSPQYICSFLTCSYWREFFSNSMYMNFHRFLKKGGEGVRLHKMKYKWNGPRLHKLKYKWNGPTDSLDPCSHAVYNCIELTLHVQTTLNQ